MENKKRAKKSLFLINVIWAFVELAELFEKSNVALKVAFAVLLQYSVLSSSITAAPLMCFCLIAVVTAYRCGALPPLDECVGGAVQSSELKPSAAAE